MKLNQPKFITWLIALAIGVVGVVLFLVIKDKEWIGFVVTLVGLCLLLAANAVKGL